MLGASVDGRVTCDCCVLEIWQYINQRNSCLAQYTDTVDVEYISKHTHPYCKTKCMSLEHCTQILGYTYRNNQP